MEKLAPAVTESRSSSKSKSEKKKNALKKKTVKAKAEYKLILLLYTSCSRLDSLGFHVFAGCLSEDAAKSLSQSSSRLQTVPLDISSVGSIEEAVEVLKKSLPAEKGLFFFFNKTFT